MVEENSTEIQPILILTRPASFDITIEIEDYNGSATSKSFTNNYVFVCVNIRITYYCMYVRM